MPELTVSPTYQLFLIQIHQSISFQSFAKLELMLLSPLPSCIHISFLISTQYEYVLHRLMLNHLKHNISSSK